MPIKVILEVFSKIDDKTSYSYVSLFNGRIGKTNSHKQLATKTLPHKASLIIPSASLHTIIIEKNIETNPSFVNSLQLTQLLILHSCVRLYTGAGPSLPLITVMWSPQ